MGTLWEKNTRYDKSKPTDWYNLPYVRRYENLTPDELRDLLREAKRLGWEGLDLDNCGLGTLPEELWELTDLRFLALGVYTLGIEGDRNTFVNLSERIGQLTNLQILRLDGTPIREVPASIGQLTNLQRLDLDLTQIREVPASIGQLTNLRELHLNDTQIREVPASIGQLTNLRALSLGNTQIQEVPASIGQLTNLQILCLNDTQIREVPASIGQLTNLQQLYLNGTQIREVPASIGQLTNLQKLDLSYCHLKEIPYSLVQLGLPFESSDWAINHGINLAGVTLDEGDLSLFEQQREVIEEYYRNRVSDAADGEPVPEPVNECKVIFLGDGAAGKSSLIERIVNDQFEPGSLPTDGVKMTKWTQWSNGKPLELNDKALTIRFLDFGGQEIMHSMHRCFLTNHTIYVVVCKSRDDAEIDSVAARWMETVRSFAPGCPVILALNKADLNPHVTVNERTLKDINPDYRRMIHTSAKMDNDPGVKMLIDDMMREVPSCIRQMSGNAGFLGLKQALENMEVDYLLPEQFQKMCDDKKVKETLRAGVLDWFQDLGVAYTYTTTFQKWYVLNPAWLTNGIYRLILRTPEGGFLRHSDILNTLEKSYPGDMSNKTYTPEEMGFILYIMRKFEISLRVTPDHAADGVEMIPMKMIKTPPERYKEFQKDGTLHLRWEAGYLPNNLIHRLLIRKYPELDPDRELYDKCVWRTGGWFRSPDGGCEALAELNDRAMDVYVRGGRDCRYYLNTFRVLIQDILGKLNLKPTEVICCTVDGQERRIPYADVVQQYYNNKSEMYIPGTGKYANPADLLKETYYEWEKEAARVHQEMERGAGPAVEKEEKPVNPLEEEKAQAEIDQIKAGADKDRSETAINRAKLAGLIALVFALAYLILIRPDLTVELLQGLISLLGG